MKTKLAFIGVGLRTLYFLERLKEHKDSIELVAICDLNPSRLKGVIKRFELDNVQTYTDNEACIANSDCDAVMIFTPDGAHCEPAVAALNAGKFVFLEKPMEITEERCQAIIEADQAAGGKTYMGFNLRHAPVYRKIKDLLKQGIAGNLLTLQADEYYEGGRTYFRRWNRLRKFSGGLWISKASHDFDILQWLADCPVLSIQAQSALTYYTPKSGAGMYCTDCRIESACPDSYLQHASLTDDLRDFIAPDDLQESPGPDLCLYNSEKDTFDHGTAIIQFENGLLANYSVNVVAGFTNRRIRISGTKATIDGDLSKHEITIRYRDPSREETLIVEKDADGHGGADKFILPDFISFIRGKSAPPVDPEEAFLTVRMGLAARKSCDEQGARQELSNANK